MGKTRAEINKERDALTFKIIGAAIEVHRCLGPGLLESAYEECLCWELEQAKIPFRRQVVLPLIYKGLKTPLEYRLDLIVEESVLLELKAVDQIVGIHEAQLLTYLKLTGIPTGLLINFNVRILKDGITRLLL